MDGAWENQIDEEERTWWAANKQTHNYGTVPIIAVIYYSNNEDAKMQTVNGDALRRDLILHEPEKWMMAHTWITNRISHSVQKKKKRNV